MESLDTLATEKLHQLIAASPLTPFQRLMVDYFFLDDRGRPSMKEFRSMTGMTLTNDEISGEISRMLTALKTSFASHRVNRVSDLI